MRKYFGTDGVRGRVGQVPITPEFVMKLGYFPRSRFIPSRAMKTCLELPGKRNMPMMLQVDHARFGK